MREEEKRKREDEERRRRENEEFLGKKERERRKLNIQFAETKIKQIRDKQHNDLLAILEDAEKREAARLRMLEDIKEPSEKRRMDNIFGLERAKSRDRITLIIGYIKCYYC